MSHGRSAHALRTTTAALLVPFLCPLASVRGMADEPPPGARLKKSATIDFRNTAGEMKGKTWLGIYELDGDT
jgi:hypothetical protein